MISDRPAHPALVSEPDFIAAQDVNAARGPAPQGGPVLRRYLLAGLLSCGVRAADGIGLVQRQAAVPVPARPQQRDGAGPGPAEGTHLAALRLLLTIPAVRARRRSRSGTDVRPAATTQDVIGYLREHEITLTWDPAAATVRARASETAKTVTATTR